MGFLSGIGRGLTSLGGDMQKNRFEREDREQRLTERDEIRDYNKGLVADQENRRIAALAETRAYDTGVREATRTYNEGVRADAATAAETAATLANTRAVARAATSAGVARDVVGAKAAADEETLRVGAAAYDRVQKAGTHWQGPFREELGGIGRRRYPAPTGLDLAQIKGADLTPTSGSSVDDDPSTALFHAVQDFNTPRSSYDDEGDLVGRRSNPTLAWQEAQDISAGRKSVPPPNQFGLSQNPLVRALSGSPRDPNTPIPTPGADNSTGSRDRRGVSPDMSQYFEDNGMTEREIDEFLARQARRGGR